MDDGEGEIVIELLLEQQKYLRALAGSEKSTEQSAGRIAKFLTFDAVLGPNIGNLAKQLTVVSDIAKRGADMMLNYGDEIKGFASKTGFAIQSVEALKFAAEQSNTSLGGVQAGWRRMTGALEEGSKSTQAAIKNMGLSFKELKDSSPEEQFEAVLEAIGKLPSEAEKTTAAMAMFGPRIGPELKALASNANALRQEFKDLGIGMGAESVKAAAEMKDAVKKWETVRDSLIMKVGDIFTSSPAMKEALEWAISQLSKLRVFIEENKAAIHEGLVKAWVFFRAVMETAVIPAAIKLIEYGSKMVGKIIELTGAFFDASDAARVAATSIIALVTIEAAGFFTTWAGSVRDFARGVKSALASVAASFTALTLAVNNGTFIAAVKGMFAGGAAVTYPFTLALIAVGAAVTAIVKHVAPAASMLDGLSIAFDALKVVAASFANVLLGVARAMVKAAEIAQMVFLVGNNPGKKYFADLTASIDKTRLSLSDYAHEVTYAGAREVEAAENRRRGVDAFMDFVDAEAEASAAADSGREKNAASLARATAATRAAEEANAAYIKSLDEMNKRFTGAAGAEELKKLNDAWLRLPPAIRESKEVQDEYGKAFDGLMSSLNAASRESPVAKMFKEMSDATDDSKAKLQDYNNAVADNMTAAWESQKAYHAAKYLQHREIMEWIEEEARASLAATVARLIKAGEKPKVGPTLVSGGYMQNLPLPHEIKPMSIDDKIAKATAEAEKFNRALFAAASTMEVLGIKTDSFIGKLIGVTAAANNSAASIEKAFADAGGLDEKGHLDFKNLDWKKLDISAVVQGVAGIVGAFKQATESANGFQRALGGAALGAKVGGQFFGAWGAAAGAAIGAVAGFLRAAPAWARVGKEVGAMFGATISDELAKKIDADAKKLKINVSSAGLLNIAAVASDTKQSVRGMGDQILDLMSRIKSGAIPAAEGIKALASSWAAVREEAEKYEIVGDRTTVAILKQARASGQMTAEMKSFVETNVALAIGGAAKIADGLSKVMGGGATKDAVEKWFEIYKSKYDELAALGKNLTDEQAAQMAQYQQLMNAQKQKLDTGEFGSGNQEGMAEMGRMAASLFVGAFNAAVATSGWVKAVDSMRDSYKKLKDSLGGDALANALLEPFERMSGYLENEVVRGLVTISDGVKDVVTGLANAGYLSVQQLGDASGLLSQTFERLKKETGSARDAVLAIAPALAAAISASQQAGIPLSEELEKMKAAAEAEGIVFPVDPLLQIRDVLLSIATALGATIPESAKGGADVTGKAYRAAVEGAQTSVEGLVESVDDLTSGMKEGTAAAGALAGVISGLKDKTITLNVKTNREGLNLDEDGQDEDPIVVGGGNAQSRTAGGGSSYRLPPGLQSLIATIPDLMTATAEALKAFMDQVDAAVQKQSGVLEKYGVKVWQMGRELATVKLGEFGDSLVSDFSILRDAGLAGSDIMSMMGSSIQAYAEAAERAGITIPQAMKDIIAAWKLTAEPASNLERILGEQASTMDKYGINNAKGTHGQHRSNLDAASLVADFVTLRDAGLSGNDIMEGMGSAIKAYADKAEAAGIKIPLAMQQIIDQWRSLGAPAGEAASALDKQTAALEKYGMSAALGSGGQARMDEVAKMLQADFETLRDSGLSGDDIMKGMGASIKDYADKMKAAGLAVPVAMQNIIAHYERVRDAGVLGPIVDEMFELRSEFIKSAGGLDALEAAALAAGRTLDDLFAADTVEEYNAAIEQLNHSIGLNKEAMSELDSAIAKYEIGIEDLSPEFQERKLGEKAMEAVKAYRLLEAAGVNKETLALRMGHDFDEVVRQALKTGASLPTAMKDIIEEMFEAGKLLNPDGTPLGSIAGLTYTDNLESNIKGLTEKLDELVDALLGLTPTLWTAPETATGGVEPSATPQTGGIKPVTGIAGAASASRGSGIVASRGDSEMTPEFNFIIDWGAQSVREVSPAEVRKFQNAFNAGLFRIPRRAITQGVS